MIEALYYFVLGGVVMFATLYLLGMYHQFREEERRERDAAEKRRRELSARTDASARRVEAAFDKAFRSLKPLDDDWIPARWPIRKNVR